MSESWTAADIARRIHDGPQQLLVALVLRLQVLAGDLEPGSGPALEIGQLVGVAQAARQELADVLRELERQSAAGS